MKRILITGGAGGIGRAVAKRLAGAGYLVYSCDIKEGGEYPNIVNIVMDVGDSESVMRAYTRISGEGKELYALVTFAGVYMMDSFAEIDERRFIRIMDINLMGVQRTVQRFLPLLINAGGRIIITTSELAGHKPLPFNGLYALSKTALCCYTDSLRLELQLLGVRVIELRPGAFDTGLIDASTREMETLCENTRLYPGFAQKFRAVMAGQTGTAKDPAILAKTVERAIRAANPRFRYTVNAGALLFIWNTLPRRIEALGIRLLLKKQKGGKSR